MGIVPSVTIKKLIQKINMIQTGIPNIYLITDNFRSINSTLKIVIEMTSIESFTHLGKITIMPPEVLGKFKRNLCEIGIH